MSAVASLQNMGLTLDVSPAGKLLVEGLKRLSREKREQALSLAKGNKAAIMEELRKRADEPTPAQLAHARRMLVECPSTGGKLHCWHCSRCSKVAGCKAWRRLRSDVEFFRQSEEPYSLYLVECGAVEVLQ